MQAEAAIDNTRVICDNGTGYLKMGFGGDNFPRFTIPSIVGRPMLRSNQEVNGVELKSMMFGDEANPHRALLDISYPISEGVVKDWDDFNKLWDYTFKHKMGLPDDKSDRMLLVTEAALNPTKNRTKMAECIFEKHGFGACMFETQALLSLMAEGMSTGMVLDSGDGVSHVIPVVEGYIIKHAI